MIDIQELTFPLIALGLATDAAFVKKALKMILPSKFAQEDDKNENFEINLYEFSKIFKKDMI